MSGSPVVDVLSTNTLASTPSSYFLKNAASVCIVLKRPRRSKKLAVSLSFVRISITALIALVPYSTEFEPFTISICLIEDSGMAAKSKLPSYGR